MSTTSMTIELSPREQQELHTLPNAPEQPFSPGEAAPIARAKQKWNDPSINKWRILVTFTSFAIMGASDGVYGLIIFQIREDFNLSTTVVSLIFMTPFAGYTLATIAVNKIHMTFGQRGIAIIGPLCHLIPFLIMAVHPPFPVYLVVYAFVGLGNGLTDAAWNAWIGDMVNANALMGFLHAFYGLGATVSPTIATGMIKRGLNWWLFYYTLVGGSTIEIVGSVSLFWKENAEQFRINNPKTPGSASGTRTAEAVKNRVVWIIALFLFAYMGVEVSIGGWIVEFMMQERQGGAFESGLIPTGFWAGITVGRIVLGFVNELLGERVAITIYLVISIGLELVFWLVPKFLVSAIAVSLLGCFTGPLFPGAMVVAAKLLPKHLHTAGIGFGSAFAGGGGAILPFVAGAIAQPHGVQSLQPFVLALLVVITITWLLLPRTPKHDHEG
ncbi:MFS general substrate transporter [Zopfia rhizophila CBS 207.26]|uniref:MFS general substrate transporter n=1 Tax=Zopfia rhizophila CBS 207.26 TaxID=1314779 RepID=A0A6A6E0W0_9PEZI|nr:MFS general substrate transporter [Zopfia rhizophila CBS 207.26]